MRSWIVTMLFLMYAMGALKCESELGLICIGII